MIRGFEMNKLREEVLATALAMNASGINRGTAGNVSARSGNGSNGDSGDGFPITPTGLAYEELAPADIVAMNSDGRHFGELKPSSEWRFHRDIYARRPEVGAIVHAHSPFATSLACMDCVIPAFHYMIARFGGVDVRCAPYAIFGSQELSDHALLALQHRSACLLAHHGMLAVGRDLKQALSLALELETLCEQYWRVLQIGEPKLLSEDEMARVLEKFEGYGQQPNTKGVV